MYTHVTSFVSVAELQNNMYPYVESQITSPRYSTENVITPSPVTYPPPINERPRYSTDQVGPVPVSGIPNPSYHHPHQLHYAPPYISTSLNSRNPAVAGPQDWSTGLCHCCDDLDNCLITAFCPCVTFGQIAEIVNEGSPSCKERGALYGVILAISGLACLYSCFYRSKLRARYDLREEPCGDCLVHFCCETCALCQEYRELNKRGFDMGIGWEANMDRQKRGLTPPIVVPGMRR